MGWPHLHQGKSPGQLSSAGMDHFPGRRVPSDMTHACMRVKSLRNQLDAISRQLMRGRNLRKRHAICILRSRDIPCEMLSREKNNGRPGWVVGGEKAHNATREISRTAAPFADFFSRFCRSRQALPDARIAAPPSSHQKLFAVVENFHCR